MDRFNRTHYRHDIWRLVCNFEYHFVVFCAFGVSRNDIVRNALELAFGEGDNTLRKVKLVL